jgi:AcrR family transcriptional regulator
MKTTRTYTMTARARAVEETRTRILDATVALVGERMAADVSLDAVAERADVSVQTVLRHFGSRAGLFDAAQSYAEGAFVEERRAPIGDVDAAVRVIVDHYETRGDQVLLMLAQERVEELMRRITDRGRRLHRDWVTETFAPFLAAADDPDAVTDLLVVATDVYTWKLLRRDRGLSRPVTEQRMRRLVGAVLAPPTAPPGHPTTQ